MMKSKIVVFTLVVASIFPALQSCSDKINETDPRILKVLDEAGRNKGELVKALNYYDPGTEKYEAMRFLVSNLSGHYGYSGPELDSIEAALAPIALKEVNFRIEPATYERWKDFSFFSLPREDDARTISADYLIANVEHAYKLWKEQPWNADLSFDDFCELLLPYSIGDERYSEWRQLYSEHFLPKLKQAYSGSDVVEAANALYQIARNEKWIYNKQLANPHRDATSLFRTRVGYNRDWIDMLVYTMRSCGIPVAVDMIVVPPEGRDPHQWIVVKDNVSGRYIPFGVNDLWPSRDNVLGYPRSMGKVYRTNFARQIDRSEKLRNIRSLPVRINNVFLSDVSSSYFGEDSVIVNVDLDKNEPVYLGMWVVGDKGEWRVADVGDMIADDKAMFRDVEPGVFFVPSKLTDSVPGMLFYPCGYGFYLGHDGNLNVLKPDTRSVEKVRLYRTTSYKYVDLIRHSSHVIGGKIEVSETPDFSNPHTIYVIKDTIWNRDIRIPVPESLSACRYYRYTTPEGFRFSIGGLKPFADEKCSEQMPAHVIDDVKAPYEPFFLFDDGEVTNYTAPNELNYATVAIDDRRPLRMIEFTPINDNKFLREGNVYELSYLDGTKGWVSLGVNKCDSEGYVEFVVPSNSLLSLRDLTKKTGGEPFIYRMNRQMFSRELAIDMNPSRK